MRGGKPEPVGHRRSKHHHTMSTTHRLKTRIGKTQASDREAYPREVKVRQQGQAQRKTSTQIPTHPSHVRGGKPEPVRHRRSRNHRNTLAAPLEQAPAKDSRHEPIHKPSFSIFTYPAHRRLLDNPFALHGRHTILHATCSAGPRIKRKRKVSKA